MKTLMADGLYGLRRMLKQPGFSLTVIALVAIFAPASQAGGNYRCKQPAGCFATKTSNGKVTTTKFREGDLISTKNGWTVNPTEGWERQRLRKKR